jgi:hypothetical protein
MATVADRRYSAKANCKWHYFLWTNRFTKRKVNNTKTDGPKTSHPLTGRYNCDFMWEEDPRYQNAVCRFLIGSVFALTLIATAASILERDWEFLSYWFLGLGIVFAALCLYAAIVWLIVHIVRLVAWLMHKVFQREKHVF